MKLYSKILETLSSYYSPSEIQSIMRKKDVSIFSSFKFNRNIFVNGDKYKELSFEGKDKKYFIYYRHKNFYMMEKFKRFSEQSYFRLTKATQSCISSIPEVFNHYVSNKKNREIENITNKVESFFGTKSENISKSFHLSLYNTMYISSKFKVIDDEGRLIIFNLTRHYNGELILELLRNASTLSVIIPRSRPERLIQKLQKWEQNEFFSVKCPTLSTKIRSIKTKPYSLERKFNKESSAFNEMIPESINLDSIRSVDLIPLLERSAISISKMKDQKKKIEDLSKLFETSHLHKEILIHIENILKKEESNLVSFSNHYLKLSQESVIENLKKAKIH